MSQETKELILTETEDGGYIVTVKGYRHFVGRKVYESDRFLDMLEYIGRIIVDRKVRVEER